MIIEFYVFLERLVVLLVIKIGVRPGTKVLYKLSSIIRPLNTWINSFVGAEWSNT
ncbi:hypothetical protein D3C85_1930350 [compost metagenome]